MRGPHNVCTGPLRDAELKRKANTRGSGKHVADAAAKTVEAYLKSVISTFTDAKDETSEALSLIAEHVKNPRASLAFRLLAVRRYLRMGEARIVAQWAWTAEQTRENIGSGRTKVLYTLAARTREIFAQRNPGYSLTVSPLRSLERQVETWVTNASVTAAGERLLTNVETILCDDEFPMTPNVAATRRFRIKLKSAHVQPEPTSAAPGTSDHGQGSAVDFVVVRGQKAIASTKSNQIRSRWKADGWGERLKQAIDECNQEQLDNPIRPAPQLTGPLQKPFEPWHWVLDYAQPNA